VHDDFMAYALSAMECWDTGDAVDLIRKTLDKPVWLRASKVVPDAPLVGMSYTLHACYRSAIKALGHWDEITYTNSEAEEWRADVLTNLRALQMLFNRQPHQFAHIDTVVGRKRVECLAPLMEQEYLSTKGTMWPMALLNLNASTVVRNLAEVLRDIPQCQSTIPERPAGNEEKARRRRFCLEMGAYYPLSANGRNALIADFATLLFPTSDGSRMRPDQVSRLTGEAFSDWRLAEWDAFVSIVKFREYVGISFPQALDLLATTWATAPDK
tara:strand:+ start:472 stop:1281 length:810 start_codon:yes stop_codon:yes gene_type:complete